MVISFSFLLLLIILSSFALEVLRKPDGLLENFDNLCLVTVNFCPHVFILILDIFETESDFYLIHVFYVSAFFLSYFPYPFSFVLD